MESIKKKNVSRILFYILGMLLLALGITLNTRLIPNPGDGIVQALSDCSGKKVSTVKNILDAICVMLTILISMLFAGKLIGVGIGTVLAVVFVGRVVAVGNYLWKDGIIKLSGLEVQNGK